MDQKVKLSEEILFEKAVRKAELLLNYQCEHIGKIQYERTLSEGNECRWI
jgi:hypothetical protein